MFKHSCIWSTSKFDVLLSKGIINLWTVFDIHDSLCIFSKYYLPIYPIEGNRTRYLHINKACKFTFTFNKMSFYSIKKQKVFFHLFQMLSPKSNEFPRPITCLNYLYYYPAKYEKYRSCLFSEQILNSFEISVTKLCSFTHIFHSAEFLRIYTLRRLQIVKSNFRRRELFAKKNWKRNSSCQSVNGISDEAHQLTVYRVRKSTVCKTRCSKSISICYMLFVFPLREYNICERYEAFTAKYMDSMNWFSVRSFVRSDDNS